MCVDRPLLSLDRPFTYDLPAELGANVGSLVRVPFHGRAVRGWVLGPTDDVPDRMLRVDKRVSPVPFFDEGSLALLRWVSERYVVPLATAIARSHPPRVASEEGSAWPGGGGAAPLTTPFPAPLRDGPAAEHRARLPAYREGPALLRALASGDGAFVVRPAPEDEVALAVEVVGAALAAGRAAIVLVTETTPVPATAAAIREAFGDSVGMFLGGDRRARYRMWLDIRAGRYACVIGTRPAVFAPVANVGLIYVSRESHSQHREERSPSYHVRDVAAARARQGGAVCVLSAFFPSLETRVMDHVEVERPDRAWPPVEVVKTGPEGRAPRLMAALKVARRAFLFAPRRGYGVARVCRACGEPVACASCGGLLRSEEGTVRCAVCGAEGRCASCGSTDLGIARGGAERVEEWASNVATVPVRRIGRDDPPGPPGAEVLIGGLDAVKDFGTVGVDLVGILDADASLRRPGISARERAVAAWMDAAAWARPSGRVIVQTDRPNDPAIQALVTGKPHRFYRTELPRLADAGFPVGAPVFRIAGSERLPAALERLEPITLLLSGAGDQTVCLLTLDPGRLAVFNEEVRELAVLGVVTRVDAEPHL